MKIQFYKPTWCLSQHTTDGFDGTFTIQASKISSEPFDAIKVERYKKEGYSNIHVSSDMYVDGFNCYLINVPNGLFRELHDADTD
jgi:hypothetical protein